MTINTDWLRTMSDDELRDAFIHRERLSRAEHAEGEKNHAFQLHHLQVLEAIQAEIDRRRDNAP